MPDKAEHTSTANFAELVNKLLTNNRAYAEQMDKDEFLKVQNGQAPWVILFDCSDSRVSIGTILGKNRALGQVFNITKMGATTHAGLAEVHYALDHLGTALIVVEGHSECGAVKGAMADHSGEKPALRDELDAIRDVITSQPEDARLGQLDATTRNVLRNIRGQVAHLSSHLADDIASGRVVILGIFHDLHNKLGHGHGNNYIYCLNDEVDTSSIENHPALQGAATQELHAALLANAL